MEKLLFTILLSALTFTTIAQPTTGKIYYINENGVEFFDSPDGAVLTELKSKIGVLVKEVKGSWSLISYNGNDGYVKNQYLSSSLNEARRLEKINVLENRNDLTEKEKQEIIDGKVWIGMSKKLARLSWGEPDDINKTITADYVKEQWVYKGYNSDNDYLYFRNGKLTTIQQN